MPLLPPSWLLWVLAAVAADPAPAPMLAALRGPPALVGPLAAGLERRGVNTVPEDEGADLQVQVSEEASGIRVVVRDRHGRGADRLVASVEVAAALIESWSRPDLVDPLLATRARPAADGGPAAPAAATEHTRAGGSPRLRLAVESALASDQSLWWGASLGGCLTVGRLCLGLLGRFAADGGAGGASPARFRQTSPATLDRLSLEALLGGDVSVSSGRFDLSVGLAAGVGRLASDVRSDEFGRQVSGIGPRAEGHVNLALLVASQLGLDVELAASVAPTARRQPSTAGYFTVPGEPLGQLRLALGARWGR
jgi:hypothetical protein